MSAGPDAALPYLADCLFEQGKKGLEVFGHVYDSRTPKNKTVVALESFSFLISVIFFRSASLPLNRTLRLYIQPLLCRPVLL